MSEPLPNIIPMIVDRVGRSEKGYDLATMLLDQRIIYLGGDLTDVQSDYIIMQLLWLSYKEPKKPIDFYIHSNGGICTAGFAIADMVKHLSCPVNTLGIGNCASMGSYLLASGTGTRRAFPSCRIMVHSVQSGFYGSYPDVKIQVNETSYIQDKIAKDLLAFTKGKSTEEKIKEIMERETYMSPDEAIELGLLDSVI